MPSLRLDLHPIFDHEGQAECIDIRMVADITAKENNDLVLQHCLIRGPTRTAQYSKDDVQIRTSSGAVSTYTVDTKSDRFREWHLSEDLPLGELTVEYRAIPAIVDEFTRCGPQIALEKEENGGCSAAGMAIIVGLVSDEIYDITIEWDLSRAPQGTRAVCTFGEGPLVKTRQKPAVLDECFFAVSPTLKSYPEDTTKSQFGMYWMDEPNFDAMGLGKRMAALIPKMAAFFEDPEELFRIFIRHNQYKCSSGRGLHQGFVFAWTSIMPRKDDELTEFLFHEIVHNWPRLGFTTGGPEDMAEGWFNEGIAEYYSLILPYRFGIFSGDEFVQRLNRRISGYYTNPDRRLTNRESVDAFWKGGRANRIPYQRGFMFFLKLAYQLEKARRRSLDELIQEMVQLRIKGEPHNIKVWLALIEAELGPETIKDYRDMHSAKTIVLPSDYLSVTTQETQWTLERQDQEEFDLGFPEDCLTANPRVVKGLDPISRAAEAGVREDDGITPKYSFLFNADNWGQNFSMTIKRKDEGDSAGEELKELTWWPRSRGKVESYQFAQIH